MTPSLTDLIARVERAEGRLDDEILAELICAVRGWEYDSHDIQCGDDGSDEFSLYGYAKLDYEPVTLWSGYRTRCPDASVDAALALVEAALPGASLLMAISPRKAVVNLSTCPLGTLNNTWWPQACALTPPLALCVALLHAVAAGTT